MSNYNCHQMDAVADGKGTAEEVTAANPGYSPTQRTHTYPHTLNLILTALTGFRVSLISL